MNPERLIRSGRGELEMKILEDRINGAATEALANAMYRYTFGIVGSGKDGAEGRSLGTGVGVFWKGTYLILTAAHTMETTPYERLYFLLPNEGVQFQDSDIPAQPSPVNIRKRLSLENPQTLLAEGGEDIAAFLLPEQKEEQGQRHFYHLDDSHTSLPAFRQVGVLGYPGATRITVGSNFMATPYTSFGELAPLPIGFNPHSHIAINYPSSQTIDPHGLSGCGLWITEKGSEEKLWAPKIGLYGLVTQWDAQSQVLIGYKVEELISFLKTKDQWMTKA